jgi:ferredoxin
MDTGVGFPLSSKYVVSDGLGLALAHLGCVILGNYNIGGPSTMRIVVDLNRCQGYAQCVPLAPTVLKLNGEEALMYNPNPDDSLRQQVLRAAASCPVQAILVERLGEKAKKS